MGSNLDRCHHCDEQYCDAIDGDDEPVHYGCDPNATPTRTGGRAVSTTREKDMEVARGKHGNAYSKLCIFADGCAHRDRQVIAYLRAELAELDEQLAACPRDGLTKTKRAMVERFIETFERGEHVK